MPANSRWDLIRRLRVKGTKITSSKKTGMKFHLHSNYKKNKNNVWRLFTFSKSGLTITQITGTALKNHHVQLEVKWGVECLFSSENYRFVFEAVSVLKDVVMDNLCACVDFFVFCIHFNCYDYSNCTAATEDLRNSHSPSVLLAETM